MIKRTYYIYTRRQEPESSNCTWSWRVKTVRSWFAPDKIKLIKEQLEGIAEETRVPVGELTLLAFYRIA